MTITTVSRHENTATVCMACATYMHTGDARATGAPVEGVAMIDEKLAAFAPYRTIAWETLRPATTAEFNGKRVDTCAACEDNAPAFVVTVRDAYPYGGESDATIELAYPAPRAFDMRLSFDPGLIEGCAPALFGWVTAGEHGTYVKRLKALTGRKRRRAFDKILDAGYGTLTDYTEDENGEVVAGVGVASPAPVELEPTPF